MADESEIGWAILELMGHRKLGGYVRQVEVAGGKMLRVDVPAEECRDASGPWQATQFYGGSAIYCMTPCAADVAIRFAAGCRVEPVTRWELPQPAPAKALHGPIEAVHDDDDDDGFDHRNADDDPEF